MHDVSMASETTSLLPNNCTEAKKNPRHLPPPSTTTGRPRNTLSTTCTFTWRSGALLVLVGIVFWSLKPMTPQEPLGRSKSFEILGLAPHEMTANQKAVHSHVQKTFGQVAQEIVPVWYDDMLSQLTVITPTVLPDQVYVVRKTILKTRDVLDVFSPTYPLRNNHTTTTSNNMTTNNNNTTADLWNDLRHHVAMLYRSVGEFQDLHNCHVMYSQAQMQALRQVVLEWLAKFQTFQKRHPNLRSYLSRPSTKDAVSYVHKESHLFWDGVDRMPRASDPVTRALSTLGRAQLHRARRYLVESIPLDSILPDNVHATFHNLRKELRSITDEFDVLGQLFFPMAAACPWNTTVAAMNVLKVARKLLGDINDDWTARGIYVDNNEYPREQVRLAKEVEVGWESFKVWVKDDNFAGALDYLETVLSSVPSLHDYLKECKAHPSNHFVIGNEAGDADSIVSAISLAYIESTRRKLDRTPIVSIPKVDLETQRPEVKLLLKLAGIDEPVKVLLFIDSPAVVSDNAGNASVTLVDHNIMSRTICKKGWDVTEIVDHHEDYGKYTNSCYGRDRTIAFADGQALVSSACTLVAERLKKDWVGPYPASVALLLLGVVLLDSVNLSPQVGKVTQRDRDAVSDLLQTANWDDLPKKSKSLLDMNFSECAPNSTTVFNLLQDAKYDPAFWESLSVRDALRLDYKEFPFDYTHFFGISSVLTPMNDFAKKAQLVSSILGYMEDVQISFLGIMFAYEDTEGRLHRQLALCGRESFPLDAVATFLSLPASDQSGSLDLEEASGMVVTDESKSFKMRFFIQHNVEPSRKQIGPMIQDCSWLKMDWY